MTTFYDEIAESYDEITGLAGRVESARGFLEYLAGQVELKSVVEAACGSGLYAILLAEMGVSVIGADISAGMLDQARRRGRAAGVDVRWVQAPMQTLADELTGHRDAVLCLGNSLPHLLTDAELDAALAGFARLLGEDGLLAVQVLNYSRVLARAERIVGIDRQGDQEYVRFYDFLDGRVRFNILHIDWSADPPRDALHSTTLRPYTAGELSAAMARHELTDVQLCGDLRGGTFDASSSDMLVVLARMPRGAKRE